MKQRRYIVVKSGLLDEKMMILKRDIKRICEETRRGYTGTVIHLLDGEAINTITSFRSIMKAYDKAAL